MRCSLAVTKAGDRAQGTALASDAFFPFPDAIQAAAAAGVTCVVQPGGSIRDQEVIEAVNAAEYGDGLHGGAAFPALVRVTCAGGAMVHITC